MREARDADATTRAGATVAVREAATASNSSRCRRMAVSRAITDVRTDLRLPRMVSSSNWTLPILRSLAIAVIAREDPMTLTHHLVIAPKLLKMTTASTRNRRMRLVTAVSREDPEAHPVTTRKKTSSSISLVPLEKIAKVARETVRSQDLPASREISSSAMLTSPTPEVAKCEDLTARGAAASPEIATAAVVVAEAAKVASARMVANTVATARVETTRVANSSSLVTTSSSSSLVSNSLATTSKEAMVAAATPLVVKTVVARRLEPSPKTSLSPSTANSRLRTETRAVNKTCYRTKTSQKTIHILFEH